MLKSDLQSDLAGNWQLVQAEGQEDVNVSEEKAMDTESTSVLWFRAAVLLPVFTIQKHAPTIIVLPANCHEQGRNPKEIKDEAGGMIFLI